MPIRTKKSQYLASISLAIMGVGFVATIPFQHSLLGSIIQGGFESGLVGGLADWFAVTALFRHPLGIPIPHTALLPKNRNRITATIISMLENDWLTKESIREKIAAIHFTEKLLSLFDKEIHSAYARKTIISVIQKVIKQFDINQISPIIEKELKSQIQAIQTKKYLPVIVDQFSLRKYDEKSLDYILNEIGEWARKETTQYTLGGMAVDAIDNIKADGFMQFALKSFSNLVNEEKLGSIIQSLILQGVESFQDPNNQNRNTLLWNIQSKLESLKDNEMVIGELENWKTQLVNGLELDEKINDFLSNMQLKVLEFVEKPSFYDNYIIPFITNSLDNLKQDLSKMSSIEDWIRSHIFEFVEKNHSKIGKLVEENLDKLDDKTLIDMLENNVGKDLQWIRVNGAICGFLIGLILVGIRAFF
jgi:uncharacterized membrane-anchored protein YjiN (DUF445 family)